MIDINCPGRNDIDKTKMSQKDKERNRFHYKTYYLEEYTQFLERISLKVNSKEKKDKFYCLGGHKGIFEGKRLEIHQVMIFQHKHLISKYNIDLHLFCKYNNVHGDIKKIVKCYCPLCNDLFCKFCAKEHQSHQNQIVYLKDIMNQCFNKNKMYKPFIDEKEKEKEPINESKKSSVSAIECPCIEPENCCERSGSFKATSMGSRGNSSFESKSVRKTICLFIKEIIKNFEVSSKGNIPNYYIMKSLLNIYSVFSKNYSMLIKEEYRSVNYYIAYNISIFRQVYQLLSYSTSFKDGNTVDNVLFVCDEFKLFYGDIIEEKKTCSLYNDCQCRKRSNIQLNSDQFLQLITIVSLGGGKFAAINKMDKKIRLNIIRMERRENKMQPIQIKNEKKIPIDNATIICPVPMNNSINGETNHILLGGKSIFLYQINKENPEKIKVIREEKDSIEYTAIIIGEFYSDIKRTTYSKSNNDVPLLDGLFVITGNSEGTIEFFDIPKFTSVFIKKFDYKITSLVSIINRKNRFVIGFENGKITYYKKQKTLTNQIHRENCSITCMASLNKKQIITGGSDCMIYIVELETLEVVSALVGHQNPIKSVTIYPYSIGNCTYISIISSDSKNVILWKNGGDALLEREQVLI